MNRNPSHLTSVTEQTAVNRSAIFLLLLTLGCLFCGCGRTQPMAHQTTDLASPSATPSSQESPDLAAGLREIDRYLETLGIRNDDTWVTEVHYKDIFGGADFVQFKGLQPHAVLQPLTEADKLNGILAEVDVQYSYKAARRYNPNRVEPHWSEWQVQVPYPNLWFRARKLKDRWDVETRANTAVDIQRPDSTKLPSLAVQP